MVSDYLDNEKRIQICEDLIGEMDALMHKARLNYQETLAVAMNFFAWNLYVMDMDVDEDLIDLLCAEVYDTYDYQSELQELNKTVKSAQKKSSMLA